MCVCPHYRRWSEFMMCINAYCPSIEGMCWVSKCAVLASILTPRRRRPLVAAFEVAVAAASSSLSSPHSYFPNRSNASVCVSCSDDASLVYRICVLLLEMSGGWWGWQRALTFRRRCLKTFSTVVFVSSRSCSRWGWSCGLVNIKKSIKQCTTTHHSSLHACNVPCVATHID